MRQKTKTVLAFTIIITVGLLIGLIIPSCSSDSSSFFQLEVQGESAIAFIAALANASEEHAPFAVRENKTKQWFKPYVQFLSPVRAFAASKCPDLHAESAACAGNKIKLEFPALSLTTLTSDAFMGQSCRYENSKLAHPQSGADYPDSVSYWANGYKVLVYSNGATCAANPLTNTSGTLTVTYEGRDLVLKSTSGNTLKDYGIAILRVNSDIDTVFYRINDSSFFSGYGDETRHRRGGGTIEFHSSGVRWVTMLGFQVVTYTMDFEAISNHTVSNENGGYLAITGSAYNGDRYVRSLGGNNAIRTMHNVGFYDGDSYIPDEDPLVFKKNCCWPVGGKFITSLSGKDSVNGLKETLDFNGKDCGKVTWTNAFTESTEERTLQQCF